MRLTTMSQAVNNIKICVVGGGGVGKSCLTIQFVQSYFVQDYDPTIEDTYRKQITTDDGQPCLLHVLDTAGREEFQSMKARNLGDADVSLVVYSITSKESLLSVKSEFDFIKSTAPPYVPLILVGNKKDLEHEREVTYQEGWELASGLGFSCFFETSAKTGENVSALFLKAANAARQQNRGSAAKVNSSKSYSIWKTLKAISRTMGWPFHEVKNALS